MRPRSTATLMAPGPQAFEHLMSFILAGVFIYIHDIRIREGSWPPSLLHVVRESVVWNFELISNGHIG